MRRLVTAIFCSLLCLVSSSAQEPADTTSVLETPGQEYMLGLFPKQEPLKLKEFGVSGFYRFFGTYTDMRDPYLLVDQGQAFTTDRSLFIADDTQLPNLWMNIAGRPSKNTSFNMDVFMFQFLNGQVGESYGAQVVDSLTPPVYDPLSATRLGGRLGLNLGINLRGTYATDIGSFAANMGGTHWYYLSDLTFSSFRGYNRFNLFERNPWDPVEKRPTDRYNKFFAEGAIQQDLRWGNQAFHGLILEGSSMPGNMSFSFLYGRTQMNGGLGTAPDLAMGGRIKHETDKGFVAFNTWNSRQYEDSLNKHSVGYNVHTMEVDHNTRDFYMHLEWGGGRFYAKDRNEGFGGAINAKLTFKKTPLNTPVEFHYFRISPRVINNNAQFWNTSIQEANATNTVAGSGGVLVPFASSMTPIGLMTNNRTGLNMNLEKKIGKKLVIGGGYGVSAEIEAISNSITFSHTVNQLTRSRFWRWNFTPNVGPYDRYSVVYRDAYETVNLSDDEDGVAVNRKHFTTMELQSKYKTTLLNRELYFFFLGRYGTVQPDFKILLPTTDAAYLRQWSTEFELYYSLSPSFILSNYFGYEQVKGNRQTDLDLVTDRPRNQEGVGFGTGFELSLGKNSVFNLRHRWVAFQDFTCSLDQAKGTETLAEIKVFF